jgi:NAD(P)H-hydrate epimerase
MTEEHITIVRSLHLPLADSHKGQNGRLLLIGGSELFHAASLWSLTIASRIVDLVHYCSVDENNEIVQKAKEEFRNGIVVSRRDVDDYIAEDDCILIGPGMTRDEDTRTLTDRLVTGSLKQWVIDAGALQMVDVTKIPSHSILTPHHKEFEDLCARIEAAGVFTFPKRYYEAECLQRERVQMVAKILDCIVILKGAIDIISTPTEFTEVSGGNAGMTKGGTGDVLAGLIAALACTNDPYIATIAGSAINKEAGDDLYKTVGPFFHASDLANQIPITMARVLRITTS